MEVAVNVMAARRSDEAADRDHRDDGQSADAHSGNPPAMRRDLSSHRVIDARM
jgi:hypothetical protein